MLIIITYSFSPKGSLYCDGALRTKGFTGEGVYGQSVIAIKSHSINPLFRNMEKLPKRTFNKAPIFGAAIVLIRNPRYALIAEWHRERTKRKTNVNTSNHILYTGREHFGRSGGAGRDHMLAYQGYGHYTTLGRYTHLGHYAAGVLSAVHFIFPFRK